jgi:hypothetical protein
VTTSKEIRQILKDAKLQRETERKKQKEKEEKLILQQRKQSIRLGKPK